MRLSRMTVLMSPHCVCYDDVGFMFTSQIPKPTETLTNTYIARIALSYIFLWVVSDNRFASMV